MAFGVTFSMTSTQRRRTDCFPMPSRFGAEDGKSPLTGWTFQLVPWVSCPLSTFGPCPRTSSFLDDGTEFGSAAEFANLLFRSQRVIDTMTTDAQPEHGFVELVLDHPVAQERPICMQKLDPPVLRPIERFRVVAKCTVTVDEFPLRHGVMEGLRVAWGTGTILGHPAMVVATGAAEEAARVTLRLLPGSSPAGEKAK
jgi:hypothetical protein